MKHLVQIWLFLGLIFWGQHSFAQSDIKTYAVIVGVAKYNSINSLTYTKDDAYWFHSYLRGVEGGSLPEENIKLLIDENATRSNILLAIQAVFSLADYNDKVIFYFSGHGTKGAFIPYDYNGQSNLLYHTEISELFKNCKAKYKICIADACHSGSFSKDRSSSNEDLDLYYSNLKNSTRGYVLLMSSSSEEVSIETQNKGQGIFSYFLIRGLRGYANTNNDKIITITELYNYVKKSVSDYTQNRQNPMIFGNYDLNMPISVIYSKLENNTDVVNTTLSPTNPPTVTENNLISTNISDNLSTISVAVNEINEYTEVYVDDKFISKVEYLFPSGHPGCGASGTINIKVKSGTHVIKLMSGNKEIYKTEESVGQNTCLGLFIRFIFTTTSLASSPYGPGNGKVSFYTNHTAPIDLWLDNTYIGRTEFYLTSDNITCDTKGVISAIASEGWHNFYGKEVNGNTTWSNKVYITNGTCGVQKLSTYTR